MRLSCTSDELDSFDQMDDADLAKLVRDSLKKFRARDNEADAEDDLDNTTTRGVTGGPRNGAEVAKDTADTLRRCGLSESRIRETLHSNDTSAADRRAAERLIPGLDRLK